MSLREVDGATFAAACARARAAERGAYLSLYSPAEYGAMRCYLAHGGRVGGALKTHADGRVEVVSLFNRGAPRGAGLRLMAALVDAGADYAECYGDHLAALYARLGFQVLDRYPFNPALAAPDWDYARDGRPDYLTLSTWRAGLGRLVAGAATPEVSA